MVLVGIAVKDVIFQLTRCKQYCCIRIKFHISYKSQSGHFISYLCFPPVYSCPCCQLNRKYSRRNWLSLPSKGFTWHKEHSLMCWVTLLTWLVWEENVCGCSKWDLDLCFTFLGKRLGLSCQERHQTKTRYEVKLIFFERQKCRSLRWMFSCWGRWIVLWFLSRFIGSRQQMKSQNTTC